MSDPDPSEAAALWAKLYAAAQVRGHPGMLIDYRHGGEEDDGKTYSRRLDCDGYGEELGTPSSHGSPSMNVDDSLTVHSQTPQMDDPGTLGCLLAMAREAWGNPYLVAQNMEGYDACDGWVVFYSGADWPCETFATEALALLRAIEAAPQEPTNGH